MIHEPTASDLVFDEFRKKFPHWNCYVGDNDRMVFRYRDKFVMQHSAELAKIIIEENNFPLAVSMQVQKVNGTPHLLILTYIKNEETDSTHT